MTVKSPPLDTFSEAVTAQAKKLGFADVRLLSIPAKWPASERLKTFVGAGLHGQMTWMEDTLHRRSHPTHMWEDAKTAIVLGYNYGPHTNPLAGLDHKDKAQISVYARGDDYHDLIKKKLKTLGGFIAQNFNIGLKVFVDTAPLMEKPLAQASGLGWQGKHTNLVSREFGSWLFLGVILTDHDLSGAPSPAFKDSCGSCQACLDICPTQAFIAPYQLDARKCLSYLTIEHKGAWPEVYRAQMGNRIYGCDDCLAVCPWNKFAQTTHDTKLMARHGFDDLDLVELARLTDTQFRTLFSKSAIKRIGLSSFLRNVHYALGNSFSSEGGHGEKIGVLRANLMRADPVVRGSAVWGLRQGLEDFDFKAVRDYHLVHEGDADVIREWAA